MESFAFNPNDHRLVVRGFRRSRRAFADGRHRQGTCELTLGLTSSNKESVRLAPKNLLKLTKERRESPAQEPEKRAFWEYFEGPGLLQQGSKSVLLSTPITLCILYIFNRLMTRRCQLGKVKKK